MHKSTPSAATQFARAPDLEQLCTSVVVLLNRQDLQLESAEAQNVLDRIAPEWEAKLDNFPFTLSLQDLIAKWQGLETRLRINVLRIDSRIWENDRTASVWMVLETKGIRGPDVNVYFVCELKWKFTNGKWICYSYIGMRKPCSDGGIV